MKRASIIIPTFNRTDPAKRLLLQLERQTIPHAEFEVIIVDDGSKVPVRHELSKVPVSFDLLIAEQANAGPGAARHLGAERSRGEIVVFLDDDMQVGEGFLAAHLAEHRPGERAVVLGKMKPDPKIAEMPLFERFHAEMLDRFESEVAGGRAGIIGINLYTGNVSMRREDYFRSGGFDLALRRSEDRDLGIRLERSGVTFKFSREAASVHSSDHASLDVWLGRAFAYGFADSRIAEKYPEMESADPWRFLLLVSPVSRPALLGAALAPEVTKSVARAAMRAAEMFDRTGLDKPAVSGTTFAFGVEYYRGVRARAGSAGGAVKGLASYFGKRLESSLRALGGEHPKLGQLAREIRADHACYWGYRAKYHGEETAATRAPPLVIARDVVEKVGLQIIAAVRLMTFLRDANVPLAPKVVSRLIRHLYGVEVHWDAALAPGVAIVHGQGLTISHAARVGGGCILFHNVTLGEGVHPETREVGSPVIGENVHIGPGATLIGPITVGDGTKIMAGAVLTRSVPPNSLVATPEPSCRPRERPNGAAVSAPDFKRARVAESRPSA